MKQDKDRHSWNAPKAKELVKLSGFTRWKIAEAVGIAEGTLHNILNGDQSPSLPVIKLLAQILGCNESDLTGDREQAS